MGMSAAIFPWALRELNCERLLDYVWRQFCSRRVLRLGKLDRSFPRCLVRPVRRCEWDQQSSPNRGRCPPSIFRSDWGHIDDSHPGRSFGARPALAPLRPSAPMSKSACGLCDMLAPLGGWVRAFSHSPAQDPISRMIASSTNVSPSHSKGGRRPIVYPCIGKS